MADIQTLNGSLLLNTDPTAPATPLAISRTDVGLTSATQALAQLGMFGAGAGNVQGVMTFNTANTGTADGALVERMRVHTNGFVGIGTAAPSVPLDIAGSLKVSQNAIVSGRLGIGTAAPQNSLAVAGAAAIGADYAGTTAAPANGLIVEGNVGIGTATPVNRLDVGGDVAINGKHALRGDVAWLRLNQDGAFPNGVHTPGVFAPGSLNVGGAGGWGNPGGGNAWITGTVAIGTTTPVRKLHVHSDDWNWGGAEIHASGATAGFSFTDRETGRQFDNNGGGERWVIYSASRIARLWTSGLGDRLSITAAGDLAAAGNVTAQGSYVIARGAGWEQAYFGGDGWGNDVQIGSMNANVTGIGFWNTATGTRMNLYAGQYVTLSDATLKTNVEPITDPLFKIRMLRGVSFNWARGSKDKQLGLIAQEVAEVMPEVVSKDSKGTFGVAYSTLIAVLIEAIKELDAKVSNLEARRRPHRERAH